MRQIHIRKIRVSGMLLAVLGFASTALAAGGDYVWGNPEATTVAHENGKVFTAGLVFEDEVPLVIRANKARSGDFLWEHRVTGFDYIDPNQVSASGRKVVVAGIADVAEGEEEEYDWFVMALDARTGERLWFTTVPHPEFGVANSVAIVGGYVVATGTEIVFSEDLIGTFYTRGFDLKTGEVVWTDYDGRKGQSFGDKVVAVAGDDDDDSYDAWDDRSDDSEDHDGYIAIAYGMIANALNESDKLIRAFDPATGTVIWEETVDTGGAEGGIDAFAVDKGVAYFAFASTDGNGGGTWQVEARDARTGAYLWTTVNDWQGEVFGLAAGGRRVVVTVSGGMQAFDSRTGDFRWDYWPDGQVMLITPVITQGLAVASGIDWSTFANDVTAVRVGNGDFAWSNSDVIAYHPWYAYFNVGDSIAAGNGLVIIAAFVETYALKVRGRKYEDD
ncbi:MAG: PQQ-binding-like beta-propeller repeat protein [Woeseiaceae bacterium]|nr:PQQ-binding-like beta-propeller repeat protein [Woeseiaceae bacterium]